MDLRLYQERVLAGSVCVNEEMRFIENTLGLAGEAGEFADLVKKEIRDGAAHRPRQIEELGDVLWYVTSLAGQLGFSLDELASLNYEKISTRWPNNYPAIFE